MSDKAKGKSSVSEAAKTLGSLGEKKRTASQARARRENGKSGGRPKGSTNK